MSLHEAAKEGHLDKLKQAIEEGADINEYYYDGKTALTLACDYKGSDECVELLLRNGAYHDLYSLGSDSALCCACMYGHLQRVKLLLDAGANINEKGAYGRTPLMYAVGGESKDCTEIVKLLLEKGADISLRNEGDDDAFTDSLSTSLWKIPIERYKLLIEKGYNVNIANTQYYKGRTPLMWASFCGKFDVVKLLIESGADVNQKEKDGETAIISAMQTSPNPHPEIVEYLLDQGADPNSASQSDYSVFAYASEKGYSSILKKLIAKGVDIEQKEKYTDQTPLISAANKGQKEIISILIENGANIHAEDKRGNSALLHAAYKGHLSVLKLLSEKGANLDHRNKLNWNALLQGILESHEECFDYLLEKGSAYEFHESEKGSTPLMIAAWQGSFKIVESLLNKGVDINAKDLANNNAVHYAHERSNTKIENFLIEKMGIKGDRPPSA